MNTGAGTSLFLTNEHEKLRATVEEFAREEVAPVIGDLYEKQEFPYEIVARMGELGLFGLPFPHEYGGKDGDQIALCLAIEELARFDSSVAITLSAGVALGTTPIYRFGTGAQKRHWLPQLCSGERLAAFGLTEKSGGSDAAAVQTTARRDGDEWVINGAKAFITNSGTEITRPGHRGGRHRTTCQRAPPDLGHHGAGRDARAQCFKEVLQSGVVSAPIPTSCPSRTAASRSTTC